MMTHFDSNQIKAWLKTAGALALRYYQASLTRQHKADNSPVSEADRAVESFLREKITQAYGDKGHTIIGEEEGGTWDTHEFVWAIDPIDGTRVFLDGLPLWCISLGLLRKGEAYRGAIYLPVLNEMYYTDDDGLAFWNEQPLAGKIRTDWDRDTFIAIPSEAHRYFEIDFRRLRSMGAMATHHVYVARGTVVATLHRQAGLWDLAGAHAILQSVGGVATHLDGSPLSMPGLLAARNIKKPMLVGHPNVVDRLLPRVSLKT